MRCELHEVDVVAAIDREAVAVALFGQPHHPGLAERDVDEGIAGDPDPHGQLFDDQLFDAQVLDPSDSQHGVEHLDGIGDLDGFFPDLGGHLVTLDFFEVDNTSEDGHGLLP